MTAHVALISDCLRMREIVELKVKVELSIGHWVSLWVKCVTIIFDRSDDHGTNAWFLTFSHMGSLLIVIESLIIGLITIGQL